MKNKLFMILALVTLQLTAYAQQAYQLDIKKSKILWDNRKTMGGHHGYILFISGSLNQWPDGAPQNGTFSIDMNSMRATDNPKSNDRVNKELRTPGFFDMEKFPMATMTVKRITQAGNATNFKIAGDLTMRGITNPIEFMATINRKGDVLTSTAKLEIDRLKWHIDMQPDKKSWNYFDAMKNMAITDEIAISLDLVFKSTK